MFPGKAQEAAHDLVTAPHPVHDAPNIATVLLVQIRVLQQLREPDHCGERVVQLVRDSGDEFPHPSQLFGLDELRLGGPQPFDRLFEFRARSLQVLGHPVERGRQFAKLVAGGRWHAAGKISAPNGFGSAAQDAQRMRHVPHQYPDQTRTQQNAEDAGNGEPALVRAQFTPGVFGRIKQKITELVFPAQADQPSCQRHEPLLAQAHGLDLAPRRVVPVPGLEDAPKHRDQPRIGSGFCQRGGGHLAVGDEDDFTMCELFNLPRERLAQLVYQRKRARVFAHRHRQGDDFPQSAPGGDRGDVEASVQCLGHGRRAGRLQIRPPRPACLLSAYR